MLPPAAALGPLVRAHRHRRRARPVWALRLL